MLKIIDLKLTDREYAAIGRVLTHFSVLERELVIFSLSLLEKEMELEAQVELIAERLMPITRANFKGRADKALKLYRRKFGEDAAFKKISADLKFAQKLRDHFVHGLWRGLDDGRLECRFTSRVGLDEGRVEDVVVFDLEQMAQMTDSIAASVSGLRSLAEVIKSS